MVPYKVSGILGEDVNNGGRTIITLSRPHKEPTYKSTVGQREIQRAPCPGPVAITTSVGVFNCCGMGGIEGFSRYPVDPNPMPDFATMLEFYRALMVNTGRCNNAMGIFSSYQITADWWKKILEYKVVDQRANEAHGPSDLYTVICKPNDLYENFLDKGSVYESYRGFVQKYDRINESVAPELWVSLESMEQIPKVKVKSSADYTKFVSLRNQGELYAQAKPVCCSNGR